MKRGYFYRLIISRLVPFLSRHPIFVFSVWLIYLIMPMDLVPEGLTGLLGYVDDMLALMASVYITQLFQKRQRVASPNQAPRPEKDPYEILGIAKGASQEEITKAYRKKMAEYHPDKVNHLGDELKETARKKTQEIQEAYAYLKK